MTLSDGLEKRKLHVTEEIKCNPHVSGRLNVEVVRHEVKAGYHHSTYSLSAVVRASYLSLILTFIFGCLPTPPEICLYMQG